MTKFKLLSCILTTSILLATSSCSPATNASQNSISNTETTSTIQSNAPSKSKTGSSYEIKSDVLKNPDEMIKLADQCASFWAKAYDPHYSGFFTNISHDGKVDPNVTYKIATIQTRNAYGLAKAYQLTGKKEHLDYARKTLDFLYEHAWDQENGGWYSEMNQDGSLVTEPIQGMDWNNYKWIPNQMCMLYGIEAVYEATYNKKEEEWLKKSTDILDEKAWDSRPGLEGYYQMADKDWSNLNTKTLYSTDGYIGIIGEHMYRLLSEEKYKERYMTVSDILVDRFIATMDEKDFGLDDVFDNDWNPLDPQPQMFGGNYLKPAWYLNQAYLVNPDPRYKASAKKLIDEVLHNSNSYDTTNGGPFATLDSKTGVPLNRNKSWWVHESAITSGLTYYYISKDEEYLKMADDSMDFLMKHMYDYEYGDAFKETDEFGDNPDLTKGCYWNDAFHTLELFYYTYLYGNLMQHNKPVTLYYYIDPVQEEREITLNPIHLRDKNLIIESVTLNRKKFKNFDSSTAQLKLSSNVGGEFKVTFKATDKK